MDPFKVLAAEHQLKDERKLSPQGLPERYLYSPDMNYRYAFGRWWGLEDLARSVVWVMLNPATGDTDGKRRPTLERAIERSREWDAHGIVVVNLFAYRSTDPRILSTVADPVGPANDDALTLLTAQAFRTVAAWGVQGGRLDRSLAVRPLLPAPLCLGTTLNGEPRHPLYVSAETPAIALP